MRRTQSQLRAAQIAKLLAEEEAHRRSVNDAMKVAAFARCNAVEELYELLEIKAERPILRAGKNGQREVASDRDESKRCARLIERVADLLTACSPAKSMETTPGSAQIIGGLHTERTWATEQPFVDPAPLPLEGSRPTS
ncbi:hypothetical protein [Microbacterium sp. RG1]|uniref:hypothetical protein n=1 Tax=Microbacterium sp. RG1 TaxID=2489212 RepID=UPI001375A263|nr:hypothetical protein [Microbacterium sp. RG1]